jgi:signal transduction histidine kinase
MPATALRKQLLWLLGGAVLVVAGAVVLARLELTRQYEAFETNARIVHRLLSQRVVQHDAIMDTLALLQPPADGPRAGSPEQRLPALYPQILAVQRRIPGQNWADTRLTGVEVESRLRKRPALGSVDFSAGHYQLLMAATPSSFVLTLDLRALAPWNEWPMERERSPVRVALEHGGQQMVLQPGLHIDQTSGWFFEFRKLLAADSQPFEVVAQQRVGWAQLPWARMLLWALAVAAVLTLLRQFLRQRADQQRSQALLRLGQVARLNTLGELAAGMAHELNQPLTAVLANTQAAQRLLAEDPPELATARGAMEQASAQARRAAEVLGRLRRSVERPDPGAHVQALSLNEAVHRALYLLEPECQRRGVTPAVQASATVQVLAEPVALEQIVHNLLMNALQALEQVPADERRLTLSLQQQDGKGELAVVDSGPGIAPDVLPHIFEPFYTTRKDGLGLGLSLCESLATGMAGRLSVSAVSPRGTRFSLQLPLARA